jgi:hypothetical protein
LVTTASVSASNWDTSSVPTWHNVLSTETTAGSADAAANSTRLDGSNGSLSGQAQATAKHGVLKIDGNVHSNFASDGQATARANAQFSDAMVIKLDGIANGTWATVRIGTQFDWSMDGSLAGNAATNVRSVLQMFLWAQRNLADPVLLTQRRDSYELTQSGGEVRTAHKTGPGLGPGGLDMDPIMVDPDDLYLDVQFRLGWDEVMFGMELDGYVRGQRGNTDGQFLANQSAYWAGISSVTVGGVSYTDFQLQSRSGTDWRQSLIPEPPLSVPAPPTLALVFVAFAGLVSARHARRLPHQPMRG